jgi:hypothetical protein
MPTSEIPGFKLSNFIAKNGSVIMCEDFETSTRASSNCHSPWKIRFYSDKLYCGVRQGCASS